MQKMRLMDKDRGQMLKWKKVSRSVNHFKVQNESISTLVNIRAVISTINCQTWHKNVFIYLLF